MKTTLTPTGAGVLVSCSCGWERYSPGRNAVAKIQRDHEKTHEEKR